jgi:CBS domain-containing protein
MTIAQAVAFFTNDAQHRSYPVIDAQGRLLGLVSRTDALSWQADRERDDTPLGDVVSDATQPFAYPDTPGGVVADMIVDSGIGRIPIVDPETRRVVGILSRQDLLKTRRSTNEAEFERTRHVGRGKVRR